MPVCHCPALWHALKTALYAMVSGHVFTENMSNNKWSAMDQANAVAHALMLALKLTKSGTTSSATNWPSISIAHSHRPLFIQLFQKPRNMDKLSKLGSDLRIKALSKIWIDSCQVPTVPTFGRMSPTIAKHTTSWVCPRPHWQLTCVCKVVLYHILSSSHGVFSCFFLNFGPHIVVLQ